MKYKPGDEVLVKGAITDLHEGTDHPYFVAVNYDSVHWVSEDKIIPMGKTYSDGLNDAWELAKKVLLSKDKGGLTTNEIADIFYTTYPTDVFEKYSYEEALAKIEAYEKEKEIKVGDVVEIFHNGGKGVVVRILAEDGLNIVLENGLFYADCSRGDCVKTGKHIDIESLLRQIGE